MDNEFTYPPCESCKAHKLLQEDMENLAKENRSQHAKIEESLSLVSTDIKWVVLIGKWMLGALVGYMLALGYRVYESDYVSHKELDAIKAEIKDGDKRHYQNERDIHTILGELKMIVDRLSKND